MYGYKHIIMVNYKINIYDSFAGQRKAYSEEEKYVFYI